LFFDCPKSKIGIGFGNNIYAKQLSPLINLLGVIIGIILLMLFVPRFASILADVIGIVVKTHGDELMMAWLLKMTRT